MSCGGTLHENCHPPIFPHTAFPICSGFFTRRNSDRSGSWKKWFEGAFSEPSLGGSATPIPAIAHHREGNPSVLWNALAHPATIPRARFAATEQKANSCYEVGQA
jgi:hypothetical protein